MIFFRTVGPVLAALCVACVNTPYKSLPIQSLTDEQLIQELDACARGVGSSISRTQYLLATMPDPAYVMTSSSTFVSGTARTSFSAYAMPIGYGSRMTGVAASSINGVASSQYQYTDANSLARGMQGLAAAIAVSQTAAFRERGFEAVAEMKARTERKRAEMQAVIDGFFVKHPAAVPKANLIAAILPWVSGSRPPMEALEMARDIALEPAGAGLVGKWFGTFSQVSMLPDGRSASYNNFVRVTFEQSGERVRGTGDLGNGENIQVVGTLSNGVISGVITNQSAVIISRVFGAATESQIMVKFEGSGAGMNVNGVATLFR